MAFFFKVQEIHLPDWYRGEEQNHQNDLSLFVLKTPFELTNKVSPVCLDLSSEIFDDEQLSSGNVGKVINHFI